MKIKLKVGKVFDGAVWPAGSVVDVPEDEAMKLVDVGEATVVQTAPPAARPSTARVRSAQDENDSDGA